MDAKLIEDVGIRNWDGNEINWSTESFNNDCFVDLLKTVQETIKTGHFTVNEDVKDRNILRILLHSFGSQMWFSENEEETHSDILKFLYMFRSLMRQAYAVAMITVPPHIFQQVSILYLQISLHSIHALFCCRMPLSNE